MVEKKKKKSIIPQNILFTELLGQITNVRIHTQLNKDVSDGLVIARTALSEWLRLKPSW